MNNFQILELLPNRGLEPRQFLRYCFGIAELSTEHLLEEETDSQYRKNCITVLSSVFNIERATVRNWGNDLNFEGIPNYCKIGLAYIHATGINLNVIEERCRQQQFLNILKGDYIPPLVEAQTFLETILLNGLSEQQKVRVVSHSEFHKTCIKTLTEVLHVGTRSVQKWGQDISFSKMPRIHKHTLGYALAAISKNASLTGKYNTALSKMWEKAA